MNCYSLTINCQFCQKIVLRILFDFYRQLKAIVIVIGKIKCNCNLIVIDINVIDHVCVLMTAVASSF